jgi:hypothetical protein
MCLQDHVRNRSPHCAGTGAGTRNLPATFAWLTLPAVWLLWASPAGAVIKVDMPVSKIYETSQAVAVGIVDRVNAENRALEVKVRETLKGPPVGQRFRVQVLGPADLFGRVAPEQPIALFVGKVRGGAIAIVHLADTWLLANRVPGAEPPLWRIMQLHNDARQAFPGRTAALLTLLQEMKAGKPTILDKLDQSPFTAARQVARLPVQRPLWLLAGDFDGGGKPGLVVGTAAGPRLFLAGPDGYADVTQQWGGLRGGADYRAVGGLSGRGHLHLLLDDTLWINSGRKFTPVRPAGMTLPRSARPLAAALVDGAGKGRLDAVFLAANGELRIYENPGALDTPWRAQPPRTLWSADEPPPLAAEIGNFGDSSGPCALVVRASGITRYGLRPGDAAAADFARLTGTEFSRYSGKFPAGLKNSRVAGLDVNGDGRRDLFVLCRSSGLLLVNRGFGAFLADADAGGVFTAPGPNPPPFRLAPSAVWAPAALGEDRCEGLLVLTEAGVLFQVFHKP